MKKTFKILIGIGVLLIALIVAGVAVLSSMDFNDYKALIAEKANEATGRDLVISGDLELNISLSPSVSVNGVTFSNASWGSNPEMLNLESFAAEVALIPLLSGDVQVKRIVLKGVNVLLETDDGGHGNWEFKPGDGGGDDASSGGGDDSDGSLPVVHSVLIQDVNVQYKDGVTGQAHYLALANLDLTANGASDPMSLVMEAIYNNESIAVAGTLGSIAALSDNDMFPVKLDISTLGAKIGLDGTVKEPRAGKGLNIGFSVSGDNIAAVASRGMTMAGVDGDAPLPAKSLTVSGALRDVDGGYAIDGLALKIGGSDLSGNLAISMAGARPALTADFSSTHFDVADVQAPGSTETPATESSTDDGRVFPNDPLPLDGLKSADATISFAGQKVIASGVILGNVNAKIDLSGGVLNVSSFGFDFGGGRIDGNVKLDGSGSAAKLALSVDGNKIDYGKILKDMTGEETVTGMTDVTVKANGAGKSVRALMAGLDGKLRVVSEKGHIDSGALTFLTGPLAGLLGGDDTNDLRCAVLDFDIVKGMATSKATVFETGGLSIVGEGSIDLREEKLDLHFDPRAKSASVASAAEVGIVVGGTLKEPSVGPDMVDAAMGAASLATGIATGGISLLIGAVVDTVVSGLDNTDYCALALAGKPLAPDEQAQSESPDPARAEQPAAQEEQAPVEGLLNNLFGN